MTRTRITTDGIDPAVLTKANVGLPNVDNTSDANKPVSAATQAALNAKANAAHTHASSDIADSTVAGRSLLTSADAPAQRTSLGLGTMATAAAADYLARAGGTMTGVVAVTAGTAAAPGVAISSDTDTGITQAGGANTLSVATAGVERWRIGSDGSLQTTAVGDTNNTLRPAGHVRAWARFNGYLTGTNAPMRSFNVSSVTRTSAGMYVVNLATPLSSAPNGAAVANAVTADNPTAIGDFNQMANAVVLTATTVRVGVVDIANAFTDGAVTLIVCDL